MSRSTRAAALAAGLVLALVAAVGIAIWLRRSPDDQAQASELFELRNLGVARLENNRYADAAEAFEQLVALAPDEPMGRQNLAIARVLQAENTGREQAEQHAQAQRQASEAVHRLKTEMSDSAAADFIEARLLLHHGDQEGAIAAFERAAAKSPDDPAMWYSLYMARKNASDDRLRAQAEEALEQAYQRASDNLPVALDWALAQVLARDPGAVETLQTLRPLVAALAEGVQERTNYDVLMYFDEALSAARQENWQMATVRTRNVMGLLISEEATKSDRRRVDPHLLEFVRFDFLDDSLQNLAGMRPSPTPLEARLVESPAPGLNGLAGVRDAQLADFNLDGRLDLIVLQDRRVAVFARSDEGGAWELLAEAETPSGARRLLAVDLDVDFDENYKLVPHAPGEGAVEEAPREDSITGEQMNQKAAWCVSADVDLIVYGDDGLRIYENRLDDEGKTRTLVPRDLQPELLELKSVSAVAAVDVDAEGDLDLVVLSDAGVSIWSNRGDFTFRDLTGRIAGFPEDFQPAAIAVCDWDRDIDLDLLLAGGSTFGWLENLRHGGFRWRPFDQLEAPLQDISALEALDADGNGSWDAALAGASGVVLAPTRAVAPDAPRWLAPQAVSQRAAARLFVLDFDNDGVDDLLSWSSDSLRLARGQGNGQFETVEPISWSGAPPEEILAVDAGDLEGDGDLDLVVATASGVRTLMNNASERHQSVIVWLKAQQVKGQDPKSSGRVNPHGIGGLLEMRNGPLYQQRTVQRQWTHFGIGRRERADAIRVVWTNGIPENIIHPEAGQALCEVQEPLGSCPYLYTWNGSRFEFVTDCLWAAPIGLQFAEGVLAPAREWEHLKIPGRMLAPKGGELVLQITEELWEAAYFDEVKLFAVDHPEEVEIHSNEKVGPAELAEHRIHTVRQPRLPKAARDMRGRDVLPLVSQADEKYVKLFETTYRQGLVEPHYLELDLGDLGDPEKITLFLTGWIWPTDTSINVSVSQNPQVESPRPPSLWTPDASGQWREARPYMGFPGGKTKTIAVDVSDLFTPGDWRLRIMTNMEFYWDAVFFTVDEAPAEVRVSELELLGADLHWRGFSARVSRPHHGPDDFDYDRCSPHPRWPPMTGQFTRYGDVTELLRATDDRLAVLGAGDEMTVRFAAPPAPPPGWRRDYLIYNVGWDKDANLNTVTGNAVGPLPFAKMRQYPLPPDQATPDDPEHREYLRAYQTREQPAGMFWKRFASGMQGGP